MTQLLIGADPEFFVEEDGKLVSAYGLIPGTKVAPYPVSCGAVQVDGMALEININPASTPEEFVHNIDTVLSELRKMVPDKYSFNFSPVANFGLDYIYAQPSDARFLGCNPDYNAYSEMLNRPPQINTPFRTAAGHIHIGWRQASEKDPKQHMEKCIILAKQLDFALGVPSLLLDDDNIRRQMYGIAGSFRPKPYGLEYRVLSNFWLKEKKLKDWVFKTTIIAYNLLFNEGIFIGGKNNRNNAQYYINQATNEKLNNLTRGYIRDFLYSNPHLALIVSPVSEYING